MKYFIWIAIMTSSISTLYAQHARTEHWHERNQKFVRELDTLQTGRTIFLGNSITEGFDLEKFFPQTRPLNRGIGGDHIDGLLERLDTSVLRLQPAALYLMIGINDIGAGDADSIILTNFDTLLEQIRAALPETRVYIHSILPTTAVWANCPKEKIVRLNAHYRAKALESGFVWIDLYSDFVNENGYLRQDLTGDGLHLNEAGYRIWSESLHRKGLR